jgi:GNAT superfamily N-acetyltransferase
VSKFPTLWFLDKGSLNNEWREVYSFCSDLHPRPSVISGDCLPDEPAFSHTFLDNGVLRLFITNEHLPDAPPLWYVFIAQSGGHLPSLTLAAFSSNHFSDGTVVSLEMAEKAGVYPKDRVAAINWGMHDPKLYQLYVAENHRRMRIGTKIINACDILQVARGKGGFIYGGDQVTQLGNLYGQSWIGSARLREPEIHMPPMD